MAIIEFIAGFHPQSHDWSTTRLHDMAAALATIHQLQPPFELPSLDLIERLQQYRQQLDLDQNTLFEVNETIKQIQSQTSTMGLCHNDLNPLNIICQRDKMWILDWEYAANGDIFFDLAGFIVEQQLSSDAEKMFLDAYQRHNPSDVIENGSKLEQMKNTYRLICRLWQKAHMRGC
jgi:thiamine kinase-like enzyme